MIKVYTTIIGIAVQGPNTECVVQFKEEILTSKCKIIQLTKKTKHT